MLWLPIIISAYFLLAICFLIDKYLLSGPIPHPRVYVFYVGLMSIFVVFLIPFTGFFIPKTEILILSLFTGMVFVLALYSLYSSLRLFEASRVVPVVGGLSPFFVLFLIYISSGGETFLSFPKAIAFGLLVMGSVLITLRKETNISLNVLKYSLVTAFLFALQIVLAKHVYLNQPFWNGFIWIKLGNVLAALLFLIISSELKKKIYKPKKTMIEFFSGLGIRIKTAFIFVLSKGLGALANILQNWAIALAPLASVALINALQGVQYFFLIFLAFIIAFKYPKILKEEISPAIAFQKIISILFIGAGLSILFLL